MQIRARIVAGTALALVMTAAHAGASAPAATRPSAESARALVQAASDGAALHRHLLLAQAEEEDGDLSEEERRRREAEEAPAPTQDAPEPADEAPAPAEEEADRAAEPVPGEPAPPPPQQEAPPPPAQETPPPPVSPPPPEEDAPPPPADDGGQPPADSGTEPIPGESAPTPPQETPPPPAEEDAPPPADDGGQPPADSGTEPIPGESAPTPPQRDDAPPPSEDDAQPPADSGTEPIPGESAPTPPQQDGAPPPPDQGGQPPAIEGGTEPVREDQLEAPILDSEKEAGAGETQPEATQQPVEEAGPPPTSDEDAQQFEEPVEVESLRAEEGRRVERREERPERPEGANVLREIGDRIVIQLGNQVIVQSDDRGRIGRDASEVYYEELPRGRVRETVVRPNGVQVVTVYDRYGDVMRRSRIMPDGREHVLVYAGGGRDREERRQWRDPGLDMPPLRLSIPADEYILDAGRVSDEQDYYDFLDQPPVDQVRRLYSVDEVRYSARVRDSVRRIDLDTITFDFGSATISEEAIPRLAGVADAMERLLDRNPGETFLIEGHTDAVGSDEANLALSDRRAEAIAAAMTSVFGIPPENLVTQGYGERYLKINTQEPERENRRVAIRRITPLVAPVASAQ